MGELILLKHIARGLALLLIGLGFSTVVALPAGASVSAEPEMSLNQAARHYLHGSCDFSKAAERFDWKVWLGRDQISDREVQRRLPEIKRLTREYAGAARLRAERLKSPPAAWPADIADRAQMLGNVLTRYANALTRASQGSRAAGGPGSWAYWIRVSYRVDFGKHAKVIRDYLELPRTGGCGRL